MRFRVSQRNPFDYLGRKIDPRKVLAEALTPVPPLGLGVDRDVAEPCRSAVELLLLREGFKTFSLF